MVYNPDLLAYSLSSHDQSLPKIPGLYTIWKYFKKFSISHNTALCTQNDVKVNFSITQLVNGIQP